MQVQLSVHSTPQRWNDPSRNRLPHVFRVGSSGLLSPHAVMYDWTSCKCLATVVPPQKMTPFQRQWRRLCRKILAIHALPCDRSATYSARKFGKSTHIRPIDAVIIRQVVKGKRQS
uniref:Uncharacterized protein n=1 Tax=Trichuris muris TaxID=70415 RepID=A0A5S6QAM9_TRIMR